MASFKASIKSHSQISKNTFNKVLLSLKKDYPGSNLNFKTSQQKMKQMASDLIHSVGKKLNP
jgi:hypothetical protein